MKVLSFGGVFSLGLTLLCSFFMIKFTLIFHKELKNKNNNLESGMPNLVSTLGVLGTFGGIFIGLLTFDPNAIEASIPELLSGMKTAFITSIIGMGLSIWMKHKQAEQQNELEEEIVEDGVELFQVMIREIKDMNLLLRSNQNQIVDVFSKIDENWNKKQEELIKEVNLLNKDLSKKQDDLILEFKYFANTMAEQNSKSIIEALNDVIKDFNDKISEQFGENFKELNRAVGALLIWQENYKENIEITTNQLKVSTNSIVEIEKSISSISDKSAILIDTTTSLNKTLILIDENQKEIHNNIEVLSDISNNAKALIPTMSMYFEATNKSINDVLVNVDGLISQSMENLDTHIQRVTGDIGKSIEANFGQMKETFENSNEVLEDQVKTYLESFSRVVNELNECIPEINEHIKDTTQRFNNTLNNFNSEIGKSLEFNIESMKSQTNNLEETTRNVGKILEITTKDLDSRIEDITINSAEQIKKLVEETEKIFEQKVDQLEKLLEKELTNSLNSLGTQLVTISERFAEDYTPLAERLRDVVSIAQGVSA